MLCIQYFQNLGVEFTVWSVGGNGGGGSRGGEHSGSWGRDQVIFHFCKLLFRGSKYGVRVVRI